VRDPPLVVERVERVRDPSEHLVQFVFEFPLALFHVGDVLAGGDDSVHLALRRQYRRGVDPEPATLAVGAFHLQDPVVHRLARLKNRREGMVVDRDRFPVLVVGRPVAGGVLTSLVGRDSEYLSRTVVGPSDLAVVVDDEDPDGTGFEHSGRQVAFAL